MKWFVVLLVLMAGCGKPLSEVGKALRTQQASYWAQTQRGVSKGCIHPSKDSDDSKCIVSLPREGVWETYDLRCDEDRCWWSSMVSCEVRK